jgi:hypothetical protein
LSLESKEPSWPILFPLLVHLTSSRAANSPTCSWPALTTKTSSVQQPISIETSPSPLSSRQPVTFSISHKMAAVGGEDGCRKNRRPATPTTALSPDNGPLRFNHPPLCHPEDSWACGPAKMMKKASVRQLLSIEPLPLPLSSRAKPRDLRFCGPFVDMFFDRAQRSGEISVWMPLLGNVFRRSEAEGPAVQRTFPGNVFLPKRLCGYISTSQARN